MRFVLKSKSVEMGEEFDPCECFNLLSQEQAMQRLVSMVFKYYFNSIIIKKFVILCNFIKS